MFIRYFSVTSGTLLGIFGALIIYYQPIQGDLSRIGYLSQNKFGPSLSQPRQIILPTPANDPSILVIGDSFSASNVWQSRLTELTGLPTTTIRWREFLKSPFCAVSSAKKKHSNIQFVLFQTVEREAIARMLSLKDVKSDCEEATQFRELRVKETFGEQEPKQGFKIKDFSFLIRMTINETKLLQSPFLSGKTYVSKLTRSDLFSSKKSDYLLFYVNDLNSKRNLTENRVKAAISAYERFSNSLSTLGVVPVLAITPDKLTIYAPHMHDIASVPPLHLWRLLEQSSLNWIPLKKELEKQVNVVTDLYIPNDTHLSVRGYQAMAKVIAKKLSFELRQSR